MPLYGITYDKDGNETKREIIVESSECEKIAYMQERCMKCMYKKFYISPEKYQKHINITYIWGIICGIAFITFLILIVRVLK